VAAPDANREAAVAALQLLQALQGRIPSAVSVAWVMEIPLLLQYLEGEVRVGRERLGTRKGGQENSASQCDGGEWFPVPQHLLCCLSLSKEPALTLVAAIPCVDSGQGMDGVVDVPLDGRSWWHPHVLAGTVVGATTGLVLLQGCTLGFGEPSPQAGPGLQQPSSAIARDKGCKRAESRGLVRRKCVLPTCAGTQEPALSQELWPSSGDELQAAHPSPD